MVVFLLAGPATNMASLGILRAELGRSVLALHLTGIAAAISDLDYSPMSSSSAPASTSLHGASVELAPVWLRWTAAVVLAALAIRPMRRRVIGR